MAELAKKAYGAGMVALIGTRDYRLEAGRKAGADFIFDDAEKLSKYYVPDLKEAIRKASGGKLADRLITPAGPDAALEAAVDCGGNCSIIVQFGLPDGDGAFKIPSLSFHTMDKQIRSAWLAPGVWPQTIRLVQEKLVSIEPLISHRAPLQDTGKAIVDLKNRKGDPIKYEIVL
jgi:L-iditol 2-dehydrogenase